MRKPKPVTDTEILDFLEDDCSGYVSCGRKRDPYIDSPTYGDLNICEVFTIPSQHVEGGSLREALINAMRKSGWRRKKKKVV